MSAHHGDRIFLAALLVHLNDGHRWPREDIATWLSGWTSEAPIA